MDKQVVIVVPYYNDKISKNEEISLAQLNKILGHYDCIFVMPESLQADTSRYVSKAVQVKFPDMFFKSTATYSRLLLSERFYDYFTDYDYMLIYQTDAFVFYDRLIEFCEMGYDYYGAPFIKDSPMNRDSGSLVGNGGFSLRNIRKCREIVSNNKELLLQKYLPNLDRYGEDIFFSYCGSHLINGFTVAPVEVAQQFSLESNYEGAFDHLDEGLPFGCHNWYKSNYVYWQKHIEKFGYHPHDTEDLSFEELRQIFEKRENIEYLLFNMDDDVCKRAGEFFQKRYKGQKYSVRGIGEYGKFVIDVFYKLDIPIYRLYDAKKEGHFLQIDEKEIPILGLEDMVPSNEEMIIVSPIHQGKRISALMESCGWNYRVNFFQILDFENDVIDVIKRAML